MIAKTAAEQTTASSDGSPDAKLGFEAALNLTFKTVASGQPASGPIPCNDVDSITRRMQRTNPRASVATIMLAVRQYQELRGCIAPLNR